MSKPKIMKIVLDNSAQREKEKANMMREKIRQLMRINDTQTSDQHEEILASNNPTNSNPWITVGKRRKRNYVGIDTQNNKQTCEEDPPDTIEQVIKVIRRSLNNKDKTRKIDTTPKYHTFDSRQEFEDYAITPKGKQPLKEKQKIKKSTNTTNNPTTQHKTTTTHNNPNHRQGEQTQTQYMATERKRTNPQITQNTNNKKDKNKHDMNQDKHKTPNSKKPLDLMYQQDKKSKHHKTTKQRQHPTTHRPRKTDKQNTTKEKGKLQSLQINNNQQHTNRD
ncbi:hypothetical protein CHS0354_016519 [Potamilus streckersoni]|uniref:Uncharacterized protein n=1 Tax=Potamilus streckersoni TaxID=2493646 RepID=A0AAE0VIK0_9BIVA|nr:hypothetical protein CHS0354_016519 [Potamilus streckersoni]